MLPSHIYRDRQISGLVKPDPGQQAALAVIDRLAAELGKAASSGKPIWKRLFSHVAAGPRGIYLYGPVGRGKSMLMDLLLQSVPPGVTHRRQHFYDFMRDVHHRLARARDAGATDPLALVSADLIATTQLLCFDELFVKDVADAMILGRLFTSLIRHGVVIVFTSNCAPKDLYAGGLQRSRFLPFIDLVEESLDVVEVAGPADHRRAKLLHSLKTGSYLTPLSPANSELLQQAFDHLRGEVPVAPVTLQVEGRPVTFDRAAGETLYTTFDEIGTRPLGPADMLEIAAYFHTVIIDGVPRLNAQNKNETTRFIMLVDALYDARRQLVIAAAAAPDDLYGEGPQKFEFARTASRLLEMQADSYQSAA